MNRIIRLFMSEYEVYLDPKHEINCLEVPKKLIKQLEQDNPENILQQFIASITSSTSSGLQIMQKLTILSLLILHSNKFYYLLIDLLPLQIKYKQQDQWLAQSFLIPYQKFLLKCCSCPEMYQKVKGTFNSSERKFISFESVFYIINLLNQLFPSVDKISSLGRYYQSKSHLITDNYVYMASAQALKLYISLKNIINEMITFPEIYLNTKEKEKIMKSILGEYLLSINQEMKSLVLNKYYLPFKHGYKTKLFRNQEQNQKLAKTINGILNSHRDTDRQIRMKAREQTIINFTSCRSMNGSFGENSFHPKILQYSMGILESTENNSVVKKFPLKRKPSFEVQEEINEQQTNNEVQ